MSRNCFYIWWNLLYIWKQKSQWNGFIIILDCYGSLLPVLQILSDPEFWIRTFCIRTFCILTFCIRTFCIRTFLFPDLLYPDLLYPDLLYPDLLYPHLLYPDLADPTFLPDYDPDKKGLHCLKGLKDKKVFSNFLTQQKHSFCQIKSFLFSRISKSFTQIRIQS